MVFPEILLKAPSLATPVPLRVSFSSDRDAALNLKDGGGHADPPAGVPVAFAF